MRVLTIGNRFPPASMGGYERTWLDVLAALRAAGHEARVLTTTPDLGLEVPAPGSRGAEPLHVERSLRWWWRDGRWVRRWPGRLARVERHNARVLERALAWPDAVCFFGLGGMALSVVEHVRDRRLPAVGVVGDPWMAYGRQKDPRGHEVDLSRGVHWLFNSRWTREACGEAGDVVHPGVDPASFPPSDPPAWRGRAVTLGRDDPGKGVDLARAALGAAHEHVSGLPPERVGEAIAAADVVLHPVTWAEPWGLVPLEAMAVGRPVVATATGGAAEYLRDGDNALLVPPGDPTALREAVARLAADPALRARLVAGGRLTAAKFPAQAHDEAVVAALEQAHARSGM